MKTWKREVAIGQLLFLGGMFVWGVHTPTAMQAAEYLTLPVFTFALAAFGLDWASKQTGLVK